MGWFDGVSEIGGHSSSHHKRRSSPKRHSSSGSGIFGLGDHRHNSSKSSFFGFPSRSTSHYKRSPRSGYLQRVYKQLRRLLKDLIHYMKRHPMKVFMLVVMPLITGGALTGLLKKFGIRLPGGLEKMFAAGGASSFDSQGYGRERIGRDRHGNLQFERESSENPLAAFGGIQGLMGGAGSAINLAKMFM
ncbi:hypothetical protein BJ878DRAFT_538337 [Calycina marina]|uniref:Uncharacterized protein n=1 Tax=Calycina marina TaxID=1763456 RepID=A0A9P8CIY1_9HELO|nr:hypothetical protein BJ878DRAFT_538337 [Calycina marina]